MIDKRKSFLISVSVSFAFVATLCCAKSAAAQIMDYGALEATFGEPVTTSATGSPLRASDAPVDMIIVTADEIPDPHTKHITLRVNGVTKQDSSTKYMVFRVPRIIKEFSTGMELRPGDVILTGTPEGVGFARKPPEFLKVGDVMEAEIEGIGVLRNPVAAYRGNGAALAAAGAQATA